MKFRYQNRILLNSVRFSIYTLDHWSVIIHCTHASLLIYQTVILLTVTC